MAADGLAVLHGAGVYLGLCAVSWATGRGLLRLLRLRAREDIETALAPVIAFVGWSIGLGILAGLGVPVRTVSLYLWIATAGGAALGLRRPWPARSAVWPVLLCLLFPAIALPRLFGAGLTRSVDGVASDGFFMVAMGEYAWERGLGDYRNQAAIGSSPFLQAAAWQHGLPHHDELPLLHQFGAGWPGHRFIAPALLGFLSPLISAGDTAVTPPLMFSWTLFCLGTAVLAFWRTHGQSAGFSLAATALTVDAGWTVAPAWANQHDTLLAIVYLPAMATVMETWDTGSRRKWALLGAMLASLWLAYPPGAPFVTGAAGLMALPRLWRERSQWRSWARGTALALACGALIWMPGGPGTVPYMWSNFEATFDTRCLLPGMHQPSLYPGVLWALGGETAGTTAQPLSNPVGWVLTALLLVGLFSLPRRGAAGVVACILLMSGLCAYTLLHVHYAYPAYKLLTMTWFCFVGAVVAGTAGLLRRARFLPGRLWLAGSLAAAALALNFEFALVDRKPYWVSKYDGTPAEHFRAIRYMRRKIGNAPVMLAADDWLPCELAVFYLRDVPWYITSPRSWLQDPAWREFHAKFAPIPWQTVQYILADKVGASTDLKNAVVWSYGPYKLMEVDPSKLDRTALLASEPPVEQYEGFGRCMWVAQGPRTLYIYAQEEGTLYFKGTQKAGRRLSRLAGCPVTFTVNGRRVEQVLTAGERATLGVPVAAGVNRIDVALVDPPGPPVSGALEMEMLRLEAFELSLLPKSDAAHALAPASEGHSPVVPSGAPAPKGAS